MAVQVRAAFPNIIIPGRHGIQRPRWPFTINRDSPQAQGLLAWWPFQPANAGTLYDLSLFPNNGNIVTATPESDIEMLVGLNFDGAADYVSIPSNSAFKPAHIHSMAWFRPASTSDAFATVFAQPYDTEVTWNNPFNTWNILRAGSTEGVQWRKTTDDGGTPRTDALNSNGNGFVNGVLAHSGMTWNGDILRGYINGIEDNTFDSPFDGDLDYDSSNPNLMIGQQSTDAPGSFYGGEIFETRIYDLDTATPEVLLESLVFDPKTRWDLYYELGRVFYSFPAVAAVGNPWHVYAQQ